MFWYGAPGGTQGPPGKGGAAERWRVVYPIGIATRHGAKPATTRTHKRNAPAASRTGRHLPVTPRRRRRLQSIPAGQAYRPCTLQNQRPAVRRSPAWPKNLLPAFLHRRVTPRRAGVLPKPCTRPHPPPGAHKPALNSYNNSQPHSPNKIHYLRNSHPSIPNPVNFSLKKVKY